MMIPLSWRKFRQYARGYASALLSYRKTGLVQKSEKNDIIVPRDHSGESTSRCEGGIERFFLYPLFLQVKRRGYEKKGLAPADLATDIWMTQHAHRYIFKGIRHHSMVTVSNMEQGPKYHHNGPDRNGHGDIEEQIIIIHLDEPPVGEISGQTLLNQSSDPNRSP